MTKYEKEVNKLIPQAAATADKETQVNSSRKKRRCAWCGAPIRVMTEYEKEINKLIPQAAATADKEAPNWRYKKPVSWCAAWNAIYHREMNRLASEAGLR